jgi:Helix-turn-helix.
MESKFKERFKELRLEKNLKQSEVAEKLFVSKSAVSGWEVGRNQPDYDALIKISKFFDVSVDYLIGNTDL